MNLIDLSNFKMIYMNTQQYEHYEKDIQLLPLNTYKSQFQVLDCTSVNAYKKKPAKTDKNESMQI